MMTWTLSLTLSIQTSNAMTEPSVHTGPVSLALSSSGEAMAAGGRMIWSPSLLPSFATIHAEPVFRINGIAHKAGHGPSRAPRLACKIQPLPRPEGSPAESSAPPPEANGVTPSSSTRGRAAKDQAFPSLWRQDRETTHTLSTLYGSGSSNGNLSAVDHQTRKGERDIRWVGGRARRAFLHPVHYLASWLDFFSTH